jgi:TP901 family phage tail tape measure protein
VAEVAKGIIDIEINTGSAAAQLKALQQQINAFNIAVNKGNSFQTKAASQYTNELKDITNSSRFFTAETVRMRTAAGALDDTLRKGKGTLGQYFSARLNKNSALFAETMALSSERARTLQTQFVATAGASRGMQDAFAIKPLAAFNNQISVASQRTQILGQMFRQGTTQLVNFGKNVQWAGRQLMVGFTIPLSIFATTAGRTFMDLEKQAVAFKKVYGDIFTTPAEVNQNLDAVKELSKEFTKYGIAAKDTLSLAAQAAAAGRRGSDLTDAVTESTRLATLGQMDQNQALETTIALQSAFRLSGEELSDTINFLNMVENQTVVSLQDLAQAIPRVAPVIQGLGGDVKDMALFLAAMQEGGVSAAQGANALKSGLGSLINPTKAANEMLAGFNINLGAIVSNNRGDLRGTVVDFATALQTLDEFSRQQALEQVFGKFQYARLGALFENIVREGSQAQQVLQATGYSTEDLARTADRELSVIENSFGVQLTGAVERLKLAIAPIGEIFVKMAIPIVNFVTKIAEGFNNLPDFQKKFIALATIITGLVIPAGTMFFGLLMNLTGQLAKLVQVAVTFGKGLITKGGIVGGIQAVSQSMKYMSIGEIEASIAAKQLGTATDATNKAFIQQVAAAEGAKVAINDLANTYGFLINRMAEAAVLNKTVLGTPGTAMKIAGKNPKKMARGGVVPGSGNSDTVPAMLMPGEFVVTKDATKSIGRKFLEQMNNGSVPRLQEPDALSRFNTMGGALAPITKLISKKGTGRQLNAAIKSGAPIRSTASVAPGKPVIVKAGAAAKTKEQSASISQSRSKNNFVYRLSASDNQSLRASGVNGDKLLSRMLTTGSLSSITHMAPQKNWDISGYRSAIVARHKQIKALFPKKEIRYVDSLSNIDTRNAMKEPKNKNVQFIPLSSLHNKRVLSTLSSQHRAKLFGKGAKYEGGYRKPLSGQQIDNNTPFLKKDFKGDEKLPTSGIITPYQSKNLPPEMTKDRELQIGDHALYKDSGKTMRWNGSKWEDVTGKVKGVYFKESAKNRGAYAKLPSEDKYQYAHVENVRPFNKGGSVPSLLTPGEFVVNSQSAAQNRPFLDALNAGKVKRFREGTMPEGATPAGTYDSPAGPMTKSQNRTAVIKGIGRGVAGGASAAAFPALIAGQALSMSSNATAQKMGGLINAITPVLFGFQILGPVLKGLATKIPFLTNPIGLVITGLVATAGILTYVVNKELKKTADASAAMTRAMYGSSKTVEGIGAAFGRKTVTESLSERRAARAGGGITAQGKQFATDFIGTDAGKQLLADIEKAKKGGQDAATTIKNQLGKAILAGVITTDEAKAVASDIGIALKDQKLGVDAVGKIVALFGPNGEKLQNNILQIAAEISPKIDLAKIMAEAKKEVEDANIFSRIFGIKANQEVETAGNKINEILKGQNENISYTIANLTDQYENGKIGLKDYTAAVKTETDKIINNTTEANKTFGQLLGKTDTELQDMYDKNKAGKLFTVESKQVVQYFDKQRKAAEAALAPLGEDVQKQIGDAIFNELANGDVLEASKIFAQLETGQISQSLIDSIYAALNSQGLKDAAEAFQNYFKINPPTTGGPSAVTGSLYPGADDDGTTDTKQKSAFQQLKETYDQTMKYASAVKSLGKEINKEAISLIGTTAMAEMSNAERKKAIELIKEQIAVEKIISFLLMSEQDQQVELLNVQAKVKDLAIAGKEKEVAAIEKLNEKDQERIDILNRQNEMDQRQVEVRNKGLEDLAKKEDAINKAYDVRITALDGVQRANDRVAQQQQDRVNLATALTSGDIAGAATAAAAMTQNFATGQLEDTKTALEAQQQREIDALTTSINGKMMTRAQIESEIDVIQERVYQRGLQIQSIEDVIYNRKLNEIKPLEEEINTLTEEREQIDIRINAIQLEITTKEYDQMLAVDKTNKLLGRKRDLVKEIRDLYADALVKQTSLGVNAPTGNSGGLLQRMMMGGKVAKYAMGGNVNYKGSREPAPGMMMGGKVGKYAFGNMVPGLGNTDRVPALLTPGEFVVRKSATKANLPLLQAINDQVFPNNSVGSLGSSGNVQSSVTNVSPTTMYNNNYSVNVNVAGSDASPNDIANIVVQKIKSINSRQVRGSRY